MSRGADIANDIAQLLDATAKDDDETVKRAVAHLLGGGLLDLARLADAAEKIAEDLERIRIHTCQ